MSIFGSLSSMISPDYFGDELGLPLPQCSMVKNKATITQPTALGNSGVTQVVLKEMKNGFINCMRIAESRESSREAPGLAPFFDGLFCFEAFVFSNLK
ncbi:hypothetical protein REPUB_Repub04eG0112800 [Reevesia pubescens]